jgi:hypothetical protein
MNLPWSNMFNTSNSLFTPTPMNGITNTPNADDVCSQFEKLNISGGNFSEVFHYMYKTQPNTMINFTPTAQIKILDGTTKFNNKYEADFLKQVEQYNSMPFAKNKLEIKKDTSTGNFYDCTYLIRMTKK